MSSNPDQADAMAAMARQLEAARLELADARSCFDAFADLTPFACLCLGPQGQISQANRMAGLLLGVPANALIGAAFDPFVAASHMQRWHAHVELAVAIGQRHHVELQLRQASGELLDVLVDSSRSVSPSGVPTLHMVLTDISARRLARHDRRIAEDAVFGRESDRRHIARLLHDDLGQLLAALKMALAQNRADGGIHVPAKRAGQTLALLDAAMASVWRLATELRPLMLDDLGLNAAVDWLARDSGHRLALDVTVKVPDDEPALNEQAALGAYRVTQLALEQVVHQAGMRDVSVTIQETSGELVLEVCGQGEVAGSIDLSHRPDGDLGLQDWVHLLGGRVRLGAACTGLQHLTVVLPLKPGPHPRHSQA